MIKPDGPDIDGVDPELWLDQHGDYLYRFAFSRIRNRATAEDLVQETLLTAMKKIDSFEGRSSVRTWLAGIMRFKVIEQLRKSNKESSQVSYDDTSEPSDGTFDKLQHWNKTITNWADDPRQNFESKEFLSQLEGCLSKLREKQRLAFLLSVVDENDSDAVCGAIGVNENNLFVLLYRARMRLRGCLEANWIEAE